MQSSKRMIKSKIQSFGVGSRFKILHDRIITPGDGLIIFQGMQDATAESIKSLEGFRIAWIEEAQTLSQQSLSLPRRRLTKPEKSPGLQRSANHRGEFKDYFPSRLSVRSCNFLINPSAPPEAMIEANSSRRSARSLIVPLR